jgi:hypothetical protein
MMSARIVVPLAILISVPAICQQVMPMGRPVHWQHPAPEVSSQQRARAVKQEAQDLSELSASVHADLQKLQQGMLAKDLHDKLKKMEKLAKRLRQDMEP